MAIFTLGTWGFFKDNPKESIDTVLPYAIEHGLTHVDTALVYGSEKAEKKIGCYAQSITHITTKIPGIKKPANGTVLAECYTRDWILSCADRSISNLKRVDTFLLHNWHISFTNPDEIRSILECLQSLKNNGMCKTIGISLPNKFNGIPCKEVIKHCDTFMIPYNVENTWGKSTSEFLKENKKHIMIRSIFNGNKDIPDGNDRISSRIHKCMFGDELVIGTTSCEHFLELKKMFS